MDALESDLENLETAMRVFVQTMKRPQHWTHITDKAGIKIDRPAAVILHTITTTRSQGWRVQDLAAQLGIEAPSVTRKTQELERAGYLRRNRDPLDKRAIGLQITTLGRSTDIRIRKAQRQVIGQAISQWPVVDRRNFISLFQRFGNDLANLQLSSKTNI